MTPWMPTAYHHRAPVGFTDRHGTSRMYVEGRLSTKTEGLGPGVSGPFAPHIKGGRPGERDAQRRLPDMDQEGISVHMVASIPGLTDEHKRRVLGRNAVAWFGLTANELPETSVYFQHEVWQVSPV